MPIFFKLFHLILKTVFFPEKWSTGIIIPIYKKKCDKENPDNYTIVLLR